MKVNITCIQWTGNFVIIPSSRKRKCISFSQMLTFAVTNFLTMAQKHTFEILSVINASTASEERVVLGAKEKINTKGFALVDRTFHEEANVSNDFRHIY